MTHEEKLARKLINMRVRMDEADFLAEMAEEDQTNDSNLIRRALRYYAENKLKRKFRQKYSRISREGIGFLGQGRGEKKTG
ncbi:MAG: hypothetical protein JWP00_179 [Chloroflexi bacterium]|nr:hypothetical protein [Chloroflexota bacterium]